MNSRKGGRKARADYNKGQAQLAANEPQGGELIKKSRTKMSNFAKQEQKASMELLKSKDLNNFKNKVGLEVVEDLKKSRYINPATRKTYTEKELEELVMRRAGERLTFAFEKLEKGGNPARQVIRQDPDIVKVYLKSGREISPIQGRPDQLVEYQKGLTRGIGRGRERGD